MPSSWASLRCCRMYDGQYWLVGRSEIMVARCLHKKLYIWNIKYGLPYIAREDQSPMASLAHLGGSPVVTSCLKIGVKTKRKVKIPDCNRNVWWEAALMSAVGTRSAARQLQQQPLLLSCEKKQQSHLSRFYTREPLFKPVKNCPHKGSEYQSWGSGEGEMREGA